MPGPSSNDTELRLRSSLTILPHSIFFHSVLHLCSSTVFFKPACPFIVLREPPALHEFPAKPRKPGLSQLPLVMDMERIKQNLRLRSGRSKNTSKRYPTAAREQKPPVNQEKELPHQPTSQPQRDKTVSAQPQSDSPSSRNWDQDTALPQEHTQKDKPAAETPQSPRSNGRNSHPPEATTNTAHSQSTRYGRSGIERSNSQTQDQTPAPRTSASHTMASPPPPLQKNDSSSDEQNFDLRAPAPKSRPTSIDTLCTLLLSADHLNILLHDPTLLSRFSTFLQRYKAPLAALILQYLDYQKAIKAIEYANAVARSITPVPALQEADDGGATPTQEKANPHSEAAELSKPFAETSQRAYDLLVHEGLPAYVTYTLVKLSTECLIAEITSSVPTSLTTNMIGGLSEVFCLSDPKLPDNPLIYCSEEFYRFTGYRSEDVLGRNCRFLQGQKTDREAVGRIREAVMKGEGCNEVVLNYRRDGRGFVNILMIAPLEDEKGKVKYFLGAQVDVSRLVAGGWGLEGLEKLVQKKELVEIRGRTVVKSRKDEALRKLRELSEMFDLEESAVVRSHSRSSSLDRSEIGSSATSAAGSDRPKQTRRVFGDDGEEGSGSDSDDGTSTPTEETEKEKTAWKLATSGTSGSLPGVYQRYCLIRPAPSLRIIFVSPALRKKSNIGQKPFLSHLAAPSATLAGLKESFTSGTPVTAKVAFMASPGPNRDGTPMAKWRRTNSKSMTDQTRTNEKDPSSLGRTCWISATPLLGGDDEVGVWMVVFVDKSIAPGRTLSKTKGQGMKHQQLEGRALGIAKAEDRNGQIQALSDDIKKDDIPIKPVHVGGTSVNGTPRRNEGLSPSEDREAAREMYDNDGKEAVQKEASEVASETAANDQPLGESSTAGETTTNESSDEQLKDDADFERVPKADSANDEDSGSGPTENDDNEFETARDEKPPTSPREAIAAQQQNMNMNRIDDNDNDDENETLIRRHSQPLTPSAKERVVIWSEGDSDGEKEGDGGRNTEVEADVDAASGGSFPGKIDEDEEESTPRAKHHHNHAHSHIHNKKHTQSDEGYEEGEEASRLGTGTGGSSSRAPLYMDYLRHPGTREQRQGAAGGGATPSDPDCEVWSPYSVD